MQTFYSDDSNIPITQANQVLQTGDGYIWTASYDGLIRFDGRNSRFFGKTDGFPTSNVNRLYEDINGNLWIGTNDAGLVVYSQGRFQSFDMETGLTSNSVRAITGSDDGYVYASTVTALVEVSPERQIRVIPWPTGHGTYAIESMVADDGSLWFAMAGGGVLVLDRHAPDDRFVRDNYPSKSFFEQEIISVYQDSRGIIFLGTRSNSVIKMDQGQVGVIDTGNRSNINSFYEDRSGRVWLCSDRGIGYIENGLFRAVDGTIVDASVQNMVQGYEGDYWLASSRKGLLHLTRGRFRNISFAWRIPELTVNSTQVYRGFLYIAADEGLFIYDMEGNRIQNELTEMLEGIRLRCLTQDSAGNLWIASYEKYGAICYGVDESIEYITAGDGLASDKVRTISILRPNSLWGTDRSWVIAGTAGGLSIIDSDHNIVRNYTKDDGLTNEVILSACVDSRGIIFAGTDGGGIYRIEPDGITRHSEQDGLSSGVILRMAYDQKYDVIWVSMGNTIGILDHDGIKCISELDEHGSSVFDFKMIDDQLWLLAAGGLYLFDRGEMLDYVRGLKSEFPKLSILDKRDGMAYSITANSWSDMTDEGFLYLSCSQGVASINTKNLYVNDTPPKIAINYVTTDYATYHNPSALKLDANTRRFTIDFAVLSFTSPSGNAIEVFLDGFDREPTKISLDSSSQVSYTNLGGGNYTFELSGVNRAGFASEPLTLPIHKEFLFYERRWVRVLILIAAIGFTSGIFYVVYRAKAKAILKRQQEYRQISRQAIQAIADTIDAKDKYTAGHSRRVAAYSAEIARRMGFDEHEVENLYYAALLHDIGKIGLDDSILNKRETLTDQEYDIMKRHVTVGGDILRSITIIDDISTGAKYHHERYDGRGYGQGLAGEDIPLFARIICVADAYDAMSSNRPYRNSRSTEYIISELERGSGQQFDSRISRKMIEIIRAGIRLTGDEAI